MHNRPESSQRAGSAPQGTRGQLGWVGTYLMCRKLERNRFLWGSGGSLMIRKVKQPRLRLRRLAVVDEESRAPRRRIICTATSARGAVKARKRRKGAIKRGQTEATPTVWENTVPRPCSPPARSAARDPSAPFDLAFRRQPSL